MNRIYLLIAASLIFSRSLFAEPVIVSDQVNKIPLGKSIEILEDKDRKYTIEDVTSAALSGQFVKSQNDSPSFGFTGSAYWVRFTIASKDLTANDWLLELDYPLMDEISFFEFKSGVFNRGETTGYSYPFLQRDIKHRNFVFKLELPPSGLRTYYLRFENKDRMDIPLTLWSQKAFHEKDHSGQYILGIYYGILLVMFLYNFFLFFAIRDRSYLFYIIYIAVFALWQLTQNGLAYEYFWPDFAGNHYIPQSSSLVIICIIQFAQSFLNTVKNSAVLNKVLKVLKILLLIHMVTPFIIGYSESTQLSVVLALPSLILVFITGAHCLYRGYRPARYFMAAWTLFLAGGIIYGLKVSAVVPNNFFTSYAIQFGSALEVILLSLGLGDRINILRDEMDEARRTLIEEQENSLNQQTAMAKSFARFVPKEFLHFLNRKSIADVRLGDQVLVEMTVLFSDIRSFTSFSERHTPQESIDFLNSYLMSVGPIIRKNNGFIDKYIGDSIMALFPDSVDDAVRAAIDMNRVLEDFNGLRELSNQEQIEIGIGIHIGNLMLGTIGETDRIETTVISDVVNTASRLESLTKKTESNIIISRDAFDKLENRHIFKIEKIGSARFKGKELPLTIFEVKVTPYDSSDT